MDEVRRSAANADTPLSCPQSNFFPAHAALAAQPACRILRCGSRLLLAVSLGRLLTMLAARGAELSGATRHRAWNQFRVRGHRLRREEGSGKGSRDWPAWRDR